MTNHNDLSNRQDLFNKLLPEWEKVIQYLAHRLMSTRTLDRGLIESQDLQNKLRETMWRAVETYDSTKEASLDTWINFLLRRECSLIVEDHYNRVPRDGDGDPIPILSLTPSFDPDDDESWVLNIEDPCSTYDIEAVEGNEWFKRNAHLIFRVLNKHGAIDEVKAFAMILSGKYSSDKEIAKVMHVNWAKVGEVRLKAKLVFALMENIPLSRFTKDKNAEKVFKRIKSRLRPYLKQPTALTGVSSRLTL